MHTHRKARTLTAITLFGTGLAALLTASQPALADHRDSIGSRAWGTSSGFSIHYGLPQHDYRLSRPYRIHDGRYGTRFGGRYNHSSRSNHGWSRHSRFDRFDRHNRYDNTDFAVSILVGNLIASNWQSSWRGHDRYRANTRRSDPPGYVFNRSLGYIREDVVRTLSRPQPRRYDSYEYRGEPRYYEHERDDYRAHDREQELGTTLYRDQHGQCYEKERDRQGRTIRRRVAPQHCD